MASEISPGFHKFFARSQVPRLAALCMFAVHKTVERLLGEPGSMLPIPFSWMVRRDTLTSSWILNKNGIGLSLPSSYKCCVNYSWVGVSRRTRTLSPQFLRFLPFLQLGFLSRFLLAFRDWSIIGCNISVTFFEEWKDIRNAAVLSRHGATV